MIKKISFLFAVLAMVLLSSPIALAKSVTFSNYGTVAFPANIEVSENTEGIAYTFIAKDNAIWRGSSMTPYKVISNNSEAISTFETSPEKFIPILNKALETPLASGSRILQIDKAKIISLGDKKVLMASTKYTVDKFGAVLNVDFYLLRTASGIGMEAFICTDADTQYWRPYNTQILMSH